MRKARLLWGFFVLAGTCFGQGIPYQSNVFTSANSAPPGSQTTMYTVPFATITVCGATPIGNPCTNTVVIYSNATMSVTAHNPITADVHGRYNFWAPAGIYSYNVKSADGTNYGNFYLSLGGSGGGSSISLQHNGTAVGNQNVLNFNDTTPAAPTGFVNVIFGSDSTGKLSAWVPIGGSSFSLTTTGTSGAATYTSGVLNIPDYTYTLTVPKITALGTLTNDTSGSAAKIGGIAISGTPGIGQVPVAISSSAATWQTISSAGGGISGQTTNCVLKANSATTSDASAHLCDDGTTLTASEPISITATTPGAIGLGAGTGSIPTLAANSAGFAAPVSGGTAYRYKLPATAAAGVLHSGTPGTVDGVNESAITASAVNLASEVSGLLPIASGGTGTASPGLVAGTNVTITGSWPNQTVNSSGGGSSATVASAEVVAFSATPTFSTSFNVSRIVLTGNITSFTLGAGADGQSKTLCFAQGAGPYSVSPPANVHGFFTIGTTNGAWNCQNFTYDNTDSLWLANSLGVQNE